MLVALARCLRLSLNVPFMERQWNVSGTQIGDFLSKVRAHTVHDSLANHVSLTDERCARIRQRKQC
jgi:hypothetical protein